MEHDALQGVTVDSTNSDRAVAALLGALDTLRYLTNRTPGPGYAKAVRTAWDVVDVMRMRFRLDVGEPPFNDHRRALAEVAQLGTNSDAG